ncbi:hypothetical protein Bbelb_254400 [Branchiostoma belcheri]|nr:hypothetical protein Bbelb_254400 [Branchiostoma belcheri]
MNVDTSPVRGEYKCEIYRLYIISAIRYLLTGMDPGDDSVKNALQAKVEGESAFTWKSTETLKYYRYKAGGQNYLKSKGLVLDARGRGYEKVWSGFRRPRGTR